MSWLGSRHRKPSDIMLDVLEGRLAHDDAPPAIQSLCSKAYFDAAMQLIAIKDREARRNALQRVPESCRSQVKLEVERLWYARKRK